MIEQPSKMSGQRQCRVRAASLAAFLAAATTSAYAQTPTHPGVVYATINGFPLRLDLYLPASGSGPFPLVVWVHGGGWQSGSRANTGSSLGLLQHGVAVASVDYRLTSQAGQWGGASVIWPAQIHDVKGAVRFLRAHAGDYNLDVCRIGAWGSSAGAHLALTLGISNDLPRLEGSTGGNLAYTSRVRVIADYFGPADLLTMTEDITTPPGGGSHDGPNSAESKLVGWDDPGQGLEDIKAHLLDPNPPYPALRNRVWLASPLQHVTSDDPPMFIAHGTNDTTVPIAQSNKVAAECSTVGIECVSVTVQGAGHGNLGAATDSAAINFLVDKLSGGSCVCTFDLDASGEVDAADVALFVPCLSGPEAPGDASCSSADVDLDGDCDLQDFAELTARTGTNGC